MKSRIIVAGILVPAVIGISLAPWPWLFVPTFFAVSLLLVWEMLRFLGKIEPHVAILSFVTVALIYGAKYLALFGGHPEFGTGGVLVLLLFFQVFAIGGIYTLLPDLKQALPHMAGSLLAVFWGGLVFSYGVDLRFLEVVRAGHPGFVEAITRLVDDRPLHGIGVFYLFFVFAVVWCYDSAAYFVGSALGKKNRIGLSASPNKSWAGLAGGVVGSMVAFGLFDLVGRFVFPDIYRHTFFAGHPALSVALAAVLALLSQVGDLIESVMKRSAGVKDSGTLMRGHGGMYDAVDSLIPTLFLFHLFILHVLPLFPAGGKP